MKIKKLYMVGLILILCVGVIANINKDNTYASEERDNSLFIETIRELNKMSMQNSVKEEVEEEVVLAKPDYDIGLDKKWQDLIWELCEKNNLSYELTLAVMYQESKFKYDAININNSNSRDNGLFQINSIYEDTYKNYAIQYCDFPEGETFDPYNPDHNIRAGIGGLVSLKSKYESKEYGCDAVTLLTLGSFNRGVQGMKNYVSRGNSLETEYARKVLHYKENLERYGRID